MKKLTALLALVIFPLCGARAAFDGSIGTVGGANGYSGLNAYAKVDVPGGLYVSPSFATYKQDGLTDTFYTYGMRVGYDTPIFSLGLNGATTPKQNGYGNYSVSGDAVVSLSSTGGSNARIAGPRSGGSVKGEGIARIDVGAGLAYTSHDIDGVSSKIGQTDGSLFAGAMIMSTQLSGRYTKNLHYSEDITDATPIPLKVELPGSMVSTEGFLNQAINLRVDWTLLPVVSPYVSYTAAQYKGVTITSKTYIFGTQVGLTMVNINAAYQIQDPGEGYASKGYFTIGAGLKF